MIEMGRMKNGWCVVSVIREMIYLRSIESLLTYLFELVKF